VFVFLPENDKNYAGYSCRQIALLGEKIKESELKLFNLQLMKNHKESLE